MYARVDLEKTNYNKLDNAHVLYSIEPSELNTIYKKYCEYKGFKSVMPIFDSEYTDLRNLVIGYYDNEELVAFSLLKLYDDKNAECLQFAWIYNNPRLRLGIESLKHECALLKERGFKYLYLGKADEYKKEIDGFEILGPLK